MLDHAPTTGASINLRDLGKDFGQNTVLSDIELNVSPGEFVAIVGKSGCGKSTLLRLLAGLETPSRGSVRVDSRQPGEGGDTVRIMFQEHRLLPWETVAGNVAIGMSPGPAAEAKALEALDKVQLAAKAPDWPASLSGGQKQRVALARALVSRPRLMLLDEPLGALDALTRLTMQDLILRVRAETGFTAILVTHDVAEAVALSDRIIVLDHGRIAHEEWITAPHPRPRASAELAEIEARVLSVILGTRR